MITAGKLAVRTVLIGLAIWFGPYVYAVYELIER